MAATATSELRRRNKKGPVELISKSKISNEQITNSNMDEKTNNQDNDKKKEKVQNENNDGYDAEFWYELKYTVVRCVLIVVIFFVLNHVFNTYLLDPFFHRGDYYKKIQRQRKINEIRSRVCPQGALDCNVDLSHLNNLDI
eukprot:301744_1